MHKSFWEERWWSGQIGFHRAAVNASLVGAEGAFLGGGPWRVLVPLCGKSVDLLWLRERGHHVTGVEFVPEAIDALCAEHGIPATRRPVPGGWAVGVDGLELICGDFFAIGAHLGPFDRIWDRAAVVAIDPARRAEYTALEKRLLAPSGRILLAGFEYDQSKMQGPPWSLAEGDVPGLYAGLDALLLDRYPETDARFVDIRPMSHIWLLSSTSG